jgi:flagellar hook-basal body complex protein FliE
MATPIAAANAYASLARISDPSALAKGVGGSLGSVGAAGGGPNFGALLKDVVASVGESSKKADMQAQALATGKSNVVDVVTAVAETEVAIDAIVAVRDRVIQAYEEIMRMPI